MYTIVQVGSHQYKVSVGDTIEVNRLADKIGGSMTLDQVLFYADGKDMRIGQPFLKNVKVTAKVVDHPLAPKVISFKYRKRKDWAWKKGHRQKLSSLNIIQITAH